MNKTEVIIFKDYFMKHFKKLDIDLKNIFYKKLEVLEKKDYISKRLRFKEQDVDLRCIRIGKYRFIYIQEDYKAIFLDIMYRDDGYKTTYLQKLCKIYKNGN